VSYKTCPDGARWTVPAIAAYTARMQHTRHLSIALVLLSLLLVPPPAVAGGIGKEIWVGAGWAWPEYEDDDGAMACARGGIGALIGRHAGLGVSAYADRKRAYFFADASIFLPPLGLVEPYGRFQYGRRDDRDDAAMGWVLGARTGQESVRFFLEGHQIFEPEDNYGFSLGISF
jgi:hypothetical protein